MRETETGFLPEVESLVPENCPLLRPQRKEKKWFQKQQPQFSRGSLETQGAGNHLETTQKEKSGAPRATPTSNFVPPPPDPVFLREFNRPKSSQLIPHTGTQWRGCLSAVTSVKTQPSSGNSLYAVLLLESNYHLVVCYREVLVFCVSKHNTQQFGEQAGSLQS